MRCITVSISGRSKSGRSLHLLLLLFHHGLISTHLLSNDICVDFLCTHPPSRPLLGLVSVLVLVSCLYIVVFPPFVPFDLARQCFLCVLICSVLSSTVSCNIFFPICLLLCTHITTYLSHCCWPTLTLHPPDITPISLILLHESTAHDTTCPKI